MVSRKFIQVVFVAAFAAFVAIGVAQASHSWGNYHWARTANPFTVKLGDNVSNAWDSYLATTSGDWSQSTLLDTAVVAGSTSNPKSCKPKSGQAQVCSSAYGFNGWLGVATIWVSGSHITQGTVKLNDSYFNTATYNTPAWRNLVMCQEVGHTFGLAHQDEIFSNPNLGSCMDYTNDPDGTKKGQLNNEHPNQHDYDQLASIYGHLDSFTTLSRMVARAVDNDQDAEGSARGKALRYDEEGRVSVFERDLGEDKKLFTFVFWAD